VKRVAFLLQAWVLCVGCSSLKGPNQSYLAPEVEGRIVDANSHEPLEGAVVQRHLSPPSRTDPLSEHGATRLLQNPTQKTDVQGRFTIPAERGGYLLVSHPGATQFWLVIRHDSFQTLTTNIDLIKIRPVKTNKLYSVNVGDLPLVPDPD